MWKCVYVCILYAAWIQEKAKLERKWKSLENLLRQMRMAGFQNVTTILKDKDREVPAWVKAPDPGEGCTFSVS